MKALAFRREERYSTAAELATDLEGFAQRSFPPVAGRDIGSVLSLAFTEDRDRIRDVIENSLSHHPTPDSSLPSLHLTVDPGKSTAPGDSSNENSLAREASVPLTETMSREPVVATTSASGTVLKRSGVGKGLRVAAVAALLVAGGVAGFGYYLGHQN